VAITKAFLCTWSSEGNGSVSIC